MNGNKSLLQEEIYEFSDIILNTFKLVRNVNVITNKEHFYVFQ